VGQWKDNKRHGRGVYYTLQGSRYDGSVVVVVVVVIVVVVVVVVLMMHS